MCVRWLMKVVAKSSLRPLRSWVRALYRTFDRAWEEFVNTKVVGFHRVPPTGKVDNVVNNEDKICENG